MVTLNLMTSDIDTVVLDACVSRNAVWVLYVLVKIHVVDDSSFMMSLLTNQGGKKGSGRQFCYTTQAEAR